MIIYIQTEIKIHKTEERGTIMNKEKLIKLFKQLSKKEQGQVLKFLSNKERIEILNYYKKKGMYKNE